MKSPLLNNRHKKLIARHAKAHFDQKFGQISLIALLWIFLDLWCRYSNGSMFRPRLRNAAKIIPDSGWASPNTPLKSLNGYAYGIMCVIVVTIYRRFLNWCTQPNWLNDYHKNRVQLVDSGKVFPSKPLYEYQPLLVNSS